jgi:hypothetical protein
VPPPPLVAQVRIGQYLIVTPVRGPLKIETRYR